MNNLTLEAAAEVYSGTAHDAKPHPMHIERNKAFLAGAEWQRNHVWHKPNEKPEEGKTVLVCAAGVCLICGPHYEEWEQVVQEMQISTWAYTDDILPDSSDKMLNDNKETE